MRVHKYFAFMLLVFSLILGSCASHTAVYPDPVNIQSVIKPGDTVKLVTKDNQETEFVVTEVTDEAIIGENHKVLFTDITKLEEQTASAGENFTTITIITLGVAAGALAGSAAGAAAAEAGIVGGGVVGGAVGAAVDEDATKSYSSCMTHPKYHPGDCSAADDIWNSLWLGALYTEYTDAHLGIDLRLCFDECHSRFNCKYEGTFRIKSCSERLVDCKFECIEKRHPIGDVAQHIEGGYYSDGSYYAWCNSIFENIHPTKDKYEKTKWQKDRDECMQLTYENIKPSFWDTTGYGIKGFLNRSHKYYRECLKERGYSIKL